MKLDNAIAKLKKYGRNFRSERTDRKPEGTIIYMADVSGKTVGVFDRGEGMASAAMLWSERFWSFSGKSLTATINRALSGVYEPCIKEGST